MGPLDNRIEPLRRSKAVRLGGRPSNSNCRIFAHQRDLKLIAELGRLKVNVDDDLDESGRTALHEAVYRGDAEVAAALLEAGSKIELGDDRGRTPLHHAVAAGRAAMVHLLCDGGAALQCKDAHDVTPMHLAARLGHADVVTALLARGADVEPLDAKGRRPVDLVLPQHFHVAELLDGEAERRAAFAKGAADADANAKRNVAMKLHWTPHNAAAVSDCEALVDMAGRGVDVARADPSSGRSVLHDTIADRGDVALVRCLCGELGVSPSARDAFGKSPLYVAAEHGRLEVALWLLEEAGVHPDPDDVCDDGASPLFAACRSGYLEIARALHVKGADPLRAKLNGNTPFAGAAWHGHEPVVRYFVDECGVPVQSTSRDGVWLALHSVCGTTDSEDLRGHTATLRLLLERHTATRELARLLDKRDGMGRTPLDLATERHHWQFVALVQAAVDVRTAAREKRRAAERAARLAEKEARTRRRHECITKIQCTVRGFLAYRRMANKRRLKALPPLRWGNVQIQGCCYVTDPRCLARGGFTGNHEHEKKPLPRAFASFVPVGGSLWLFGGVSLTRPSSAVKLTNELWEFSGGRWTLHNGARGAAPSPRQRHTACAVGNRRMVVLGGSNDVALKKNPSANSWSSDVHVFELATETWFPVETSKRLPRPFAALRAHAMTTCDGDSYRDDSTLDTVFRISPHALVVGDVTREARMGPEVGMQCMRLTVEKEPLTGDFVAFWSKDIGVRVEGTSDAEQVRLGSKMPASRTGHTTTAIGDNLVVFGGADDFKLQMVDLSKPLAPEAPPPALWLPRDHEVDRIKRWEGDVQSACRLVKSRGGSRRSARGEGDDHALAPGPAEQRGATANAARGRRGGISLGATAGPSGFGAFGAPAGPGTAPKFWDKVAGEAGALEEAECRSWHGACRAGKWLIAHGGLEYVNGELARAASSDFVCARYETANWETALQWHGLSCQPTARAGHAIAALDNTLFLYGGLEATVNGGDDLRGDLLALELTSAPPGRDTNIPSRVRTAAQRRVPVVTEEDSVGSDVSEDINGVPGGKVAAMHFKTERIEVTFPTGKEDVVVLDLPVLVRKVGLENCRDSQKKRILNQK